MSQHDEWISELFRRLSVRYGDQWFRKWADLDPAEVKADWLRELRGFIAKPWAVGYALEHLPGDWPPTATVFRELCGMAPEPNPVKRLPAPPPRLADRARAFREAVAGMFAPKADPLAWAKQLREQERAGRSLTMSQTMAWREALAHQTYVEVGQPLEELNARKAETAKRAQAYAEANGIDLQAEAERLRNKRWHDGVR